GVAQIGKVQRTKGSLTHTRRIFDRRTTLRDARIVPGLDLLGTVDREAYRRAIAVRRSLSVQRRTHHEQGSVVPVIHALVVLPSRLCANCVEQRIVESLGT